MNKIIFTIMILFIGKLPAQTGFSSGNNPHDSLLFDGSSVVFMNKGGDKHCKWKVKGVWGKVIGTRDSLIHYQRNECDDMKEEFVEWVTREVRGPMKAGDEVYDNDNLEMDDGAFIQLETNINDVIQSRTIPYKEEAIHDNPFNNPVIIITAKCKNFRVPSCGVKPAENYGGEPGWDKIPLGDWYFDRDPGASKYGRKYLFQSSGPKYNIHTDQCIIKNNGTKYSLEQTETDNIIRVYEGSVEINPVTSDTSSLSGMKKLQEDYKNGKISMTEMVNKTIELQAQFNEQNKYVSKPLILETGFQVTVNNGRIGDPVPIPADDDRWWDK